MIQQVQALIEELQLTPHPEGGWYRETWRGPATADGRAVGTSILFLLEADQASHWHRVDADELWLWQKGDPIVLSIAETDASAPYPVVLDPEVDVGQKFQGLVPAGQWQAAWLDKSSLNHGFCLVSCVVMPGFEFAGFELAAPGWRPGTKV